MVVGIGSYVDLSSLDDISDGEGELGDCEDEILDAVDDDADKDFWASSSLGKGSLTSQGAMFFKMQKCQNFSRIEIVNGHNVFFENLKSLHKLN